MKNVFTRCFLLSCLMLTVVFASAQELSTQINPSNNSPYSRFGLGDFVPQSFAGYSAMGGLSAAVNDPYLVNHLNPASLAFLQSTAFEVGVYGEYANLEGFGQEVSLWNGNLSYLSLGFPIKNPLNRVLDRNRSPFSWGMNISLVPYTLVGYNIESTGGTEETGPTSVALQGSGGSYKVQWGNGFKWGDFAAGVNIGYLFGNITNSRAVQFDSLGFAYVSQFEDDVSLGAVVWNVGAQYVYRFKKANAAGILESTGKSIIFGVTGTNTTTLNTKTTQFYHRDLPFSGFQRQDTIVFNEDLEQEGQLPLELAVGVTYVEVNKLKIGGEFSFGKWSDYQNDAIQGGGFSLNDSWRISAGLEYTPDYISYNNYFRRIRYRLGGYYGLDPRVEGSNQLNHYALTFGFGLPVIMPRQQVSYVNFGFELGQFGLEESLRETYLRFTLGFTLNDNTWFFKRKFN